MTAPQPRPNVAAIPAYVAGKPPSVRPGMTGLWQVEARFDEHFDDRAELDLRYIDQWSLLMDIGILLRTVPAVLTPRGR